MPWFEYEGLTPGGTAIAGRVEAGDRDQAADDLQLRAETVIRNYDPCISCATHFLRLRIERD